MITTHGFLHITISVTDLERATAFYRDLLGCKVVRQNPIMSFMRTGDDLFVLTKMDNHVKPNIEGELDEITTLFHHAFLIPPEQFDEALETFQARGIPHWNCSGMNHRTFPGRRHFYVQDPDGNAVEITTMLPEEMAQR
jgi:glyoxylase I family protein